MENNSSDVLLINTSNLIWIDLEMTGLDSENDRIIEIATVVTDKDLQVTKIGPSLVIHQPKSVLEKMDAWNQAHHSSSGLIDDVIKSTITQEQAEQETLRFLSKYCYPNKSPMCGNSICQDRRFLARSMPELERFYHYRNLDVTTLRMVTQRWQPELVAEKPKGNKAHRARDDILASIIELKHYRKTLFDL